MEEQKRNEEVFLQKHAWCACVRVCVYGAGFGSGSGGWTAAKRAERVRAEIPQGHYIFF